jgi:hypothetical protein
MPELICPIAGVNYQPGARGTLDRLKVGTPLQLRREPQNQHDTLAVSVWWGDQKLGFVPKSKNVEIAWLLDTRRRPVKAVFAGRQERDVAVVRLTWD